LKLSAAFAAAAMLGPKSISSQVVTPDVHDEKWIRDTLTDIARSFNGRSGERAAGILIGAMMRLRRLWPWHDWTCIYDEARDVALVDTPDGVIEVKTFIQTFDRHFCFHGLDAAAELCSCIAMKSWYQWRMELLGETLEQCADEWAKQELRVHPHWGQGERNWAAIQRELDFKGWS